MHIPHQHANSIHPPLKSLATGLHTNSLPLGSPRKTSLNVLDGLLKSAAGDADMVPLDRREI